MKAIIQECVTCGLPCHVEPKADDLCLRYGVCSEECFQARIEVLRVKEREAKTVVIPVGVKSRKPGKPRSKKKARNRRHQRDGFFRSRSWLELRYQVLKASGRRCALCGQVKGTIHVDHIKPRSKYPELALVFTNLQVLCADCNVGKSNKDETDWRNV